MNWQLPISANVEGNAVRFRVWSPEAEKLEAVIFENGKQVAAHELRRDGEGFFVGLAENLGAGTRYQYRLNGDKLRPDPASRYQPEGVHGVSEVIDPSQFNWTDQHWNGVSPDKAIIYEVHVGTFTAEGTFAAIINKLDYIKNLGVTIIELLPVADFPGSRNWGYDGVDLYAPANAYGHPDDMRRLIDAAHAKGLAVIQDIVYNHLGPDGNYLRDFSTDYFTDKHKTPWGDALNFECKAVREFFINNTLYWTHEFHVDGLRLDATHAIIDTTTEHILAEINRRVRETLPSERQFLIYAEDARNENKLVRPVQDGGYGLDGVWADDLHHEIRVTVAGDHESYYQDFEGNAYELATTLNQGWLFQGQKTPRSGEARGTAADVVAPDKFVVCIQNHDQIGNRAVGDRLNQDVNLEAYRAASAVLLLCPYTPLLFMGQEWAADTPWQFFTDHNPELGKLVTEGRRKEFEGFESYGKEEVPDPQADSTFENSKLNWQEPSQPPHAQTLALYQDLLKLRSSLLTQRQRQRDSYKALALADRLLALRYYSSDGSGKDLLLLVSLMNDGKQSCNLQDRPETSKGETKNWTIVFNSEDERYSGAGRDAMKYNPEAGTVDFDGPCAVLFKIDSK